MPLLNHKLQAAIRDSCTPDFRRYTQCLHDHDGGEMKLKNVTYKDNVTKFMKQNSFNAQEMDKQSYLAKYNYNTNMQYLSDKQLSPCLDEFAPAMKCVSNTMLLNDLPSIYKPLKHGSIAEHIGCKKENNKILDMYRDNMTHNEKQDMLQLFYQCNMKEFGRDIDRMFTELDPDTGFQKKKSLTGVTIQQRV